MHQDTRCSRGRQASSIPEAWAAYAPQLTAWALGLRVRTDAHGRYVPVRRRTPDPGTGKTRASYTMHAALSPGALVRHFMGRDQGALVGLHVVSSAETCRWIVVDLDAHGDGDDPEANWRMARAVHDAARAAGLDALLLDSDGKGGYHLWVVLARPVPMADAWRLGRWLVRDHARFGLSRAPETFPKSPHLSGKRIGHFVRLPGRHHTRDHWSRVWDGRNWLEGGPAIRAFLAVTGRDVDLATVIPPDFDPGDSMAAGRRPDVTPRPAPGRSGCRPAAAPGPATAPSRRQIAEVREALGHLGDDYCDDYHSWLQVGMALRQLGEPGLEIWHEWSEPSPKYQGWVLDQKWAGFASGDEAPESNRITLSSLYFWARKEGWTGPSAPAGRRRTATRDVRPHKTPNHK
jgi:hypothetical protein